MNDTIPKKTAFLVPPLPLVEGAKDKEEMPKATDIIEFVLKQRVDATAPTCKLKGTRFCRRTVAEWIDFRKAILELWRQNDITNTQDRVGNISTILSGDSLIGFEERIQELSTLTEEAGEIVTIDLTDETITASLNAANQMMFPFRSLETQKQWMRCYMRKPKELLIWKTVAVVRRLDNSLPLFPNGKESDKFKPRGNP
jgi:hypothetical protein